MAGVLRTQLWLSIIPQYFTTVPLNILVWCKLLSELHENTKRSRCYKSQSHNVHRAAGHVTSVLQSPQSRELLQATKGAGV